MHAGAERRDRLRPAGVGDADSTPARANNRASAEPTFPLPTIAGRVDAVMPAYTRGTELIEAAAPQHVADVRDVLIDHLTPAELDTLTAIGDKVRTRLTALGPKP